MKNRRLLLLSNLLKSTSGINILKYSKDRKKKNAVWGGFAGYSILGIMLMAYCIVAAIGLNFFGFGDSIPALSAGMVVLISFVFTLIKTNGYLFNFKEYDMLMAMPFPVKDIVACKFLYMYIKSAAIEIMISLSMLIGYCFRRDVSVLIILAWIVMALLLPVIPMVLASLLGALIAKLGAGFKHKTLVQTILTFVLVIPCFFISYFINNIITEDKLEQTVESISSGIDAFARFIPSVRWFSKTITEGSILSFIILIAVTIAVFELAFTLVSKSYREINSKLSTSGKHTKYKNKQVRVRNMTQAIAFKEFKRMTGSTAYVTNGAMGHVMALILGIAAIFVKPEKIVEVVFANAPISPESLMPALPFIVFFLVGMVPTTCCSPSLEGKNYWIMKTLPINPMTDAKGKMLFNMYLSVPVSLFAVLALGISLKAGPVTIILICLLSFAQCLYSTTFGLSRGIKHRKLEWVQEIEVIKQGAAITTYMLPNMFATLILAVLVVALGKIVNTNIVLIIFTVIYGLLAYLGWISVKHLIMKGA